ncbi:hypothetical protein Q428_02635 [Fervidicella metallireducens AeB]|uniref:DUF2089 domain-containing protein n=1 Tax=Fervidicella metallireducens AeB TaxID=1403537 RepID=A0A017RX47_9CLOT|nr:DUF2089 domain-containing protein [Fervidicella metallireducens]EYE89353.1 hypothetical protein Q428_02635 [Fervidicella metallireducens AeB]
MPFKIISKCPVCNSRLFATRLKCKKCETIIENEFELSKFAYLSYEQLNFIEVFVKCRGNIKDVEKELGISYPTVRSKLDDVISALGYIPARTKEENNNLDIITKLENGEITAEDAINLLKK